MFMPAQMILPLVPFPSSTKERVESAATTNASVLIELEDVALEIPTAFVAVTANM
jgi:hypothetical protein